MSNNLKLKPVGSNFSLKEHIYDVLKDAISNVNIYEADANLKWMSAPWPTSLAFHARPCARR
jgi:hypothetical protein